MTAAKNIDPVTSLRSLESFDPATGEKLGEVSVHTPDQVRAIVAKAREAQQVWWEMGVTKRNQILKRLKGVMIDHHDEIAELVSKENGKPRCEVIGLTLPSSAAVDLYTKQAKKLAKGKKVSSTFFFGAKSVIHYEPIGVAGFIMPWNMPFELGVKHMIPALAAGNACVQKPSEQNPLIGELIAKLYREAGVPDGLVQMVHGYAEVGQALVEAADAICFVGSPNTGRAVMRAAAATLTPVLLELGGNDAAIVREDADIEQTAKGLINGTCFNSGQVCNGIERIYVHRAVVDRLVPALEKKANALRYDGEVREMGGVTFAPQIKMYEAHTQDAIDKGAKLLTGGALIEKNGGKFWPATLLTGVTHEMEIMREETFGPFLPIMVVDSDEEAVRLANESPYGLGASVWTKDRRAGERLARQIRAGSVMINNAVQSGGNITLPFGGPGDSGVGRAQGEDGFFFYTEPKSVMTCPDNADDLWMPYTAHIEGLVSGFAKALHGRSIGERVKGALAAVKGMLAHKKALKKSR